MTERNIEQDLGVAVKIMEEVRVAIPNAIAFLDEILAAKGPDYLTLVLNMVIVKEKLSLLQEINPVAAEPLIKLTTLTFCDVIRGQGFDAKEITTACDKLFSLGLDDVRNLKTDLNEVQGE